MSAVIVGDRFSQCSPRRTFVRPVLHGVPPFRPANAAQNATLSQQQSGITAQAATTMGVTVLYSLDTATTGVATADILKS